MDIAIKVTALVGAAFGVWGLIELYKAMRDDCFPPSRYPSTDKEPETPVPEEKPVEQTSFTADQPLVDPPPHPKLSMSTFAQSVFDQHHVDAQEFATLLLYYIARMNPEWKVDPERVAPDVYAFSTLNPYRYDDAMLRMEYNNVIGKALALAKEDGLYMGRSPHIDPLMRGVRYHVICGHCKAHHQLNLVWLHPLEPYRLDHAADMARAMLSHRQCRANAILS